MSDQDNQPGVQPFYGGTKMIPFASNTGFLGAATNGAMPEKVYGMWVDAEIWLQDSGNPDTIEEAAWIRLAVAKGDAKAQPYTEHLICGDIADVEKIFAGMMNAHLAGRDGVLEVEFTSYRNNAQLKFDENVSEEPCNDLKCRVAPGAKGGVDVSFYEKTSRHLADKVVSRLNADFTPKGWDLLATEFSKLREWREECHRAIHRAHRERQQEAAPVAPGM